MKLNLSSSALIMAGYAVAILLISSYSDDDYIAPIYVPAKSETISSSYIVMLKNHFTVKQVQDHAEWVRSMVPANDHPTKDFLGTSFNEGIKHVYEIPNFKGYAGRFDKKVLDAIRRSKAVEFVEKDSIVYGSEI